MVKVSSGSRHLDIVNSGTPVARFKKNLGGPTYTCRICSKRTRETGKHESSVELCARCFVQCTLQNEHGDYGHAQKIDGCPTCHGKQVGQ